MIRRSILPKVEKALRREAAVALIGPRQVGKTTLAREIGDASPSVYLDLESTPDREKLSDPLQFLKLHTDKLVILDEIHRVPELFDVLRGLIDEGRREGQDKGRFLLLGSASIDLMRQSETLAGRIEYVDMSPLHALEIASEDEANTLWLRGGFPRSFLAEDDEESFERRQNFIRTYLERDIPMFGPRIPAETLERLWTMLAHNQGTLLNTSQLARNLGITSPTAASYIDLLVDLLVVRRLSSFQVNAGKRLVKSPKTFVRDSGLVHALLGIETLDDLLGHPVVGASWEGFVIESLLAAAPRRAKASFYRTSAGAELDLVLELGAKQGVWGIEIKRGLTPKTSKGFISALEDIQPKKTFIVYGGTDRYPKGNGIEVISVRELASELSALSV
ncbi:ATP-binding protein [Henriciella sp.]|uniref:ATP-binding protein n=1 Tax=Henriciella sp. TaxID=1968823 RepID=UPI002622F6F7|nr:ATP-binding protein [Henriciella sp.]